MQGRDEYEFDYYGGAPFRSDDYPGGMRQNMQRDYTGEPWQNRQWDYTDEYRQESNRMPRRPMQPDMMPGRPSPARESCCQSRVNEILEEMERFEEMQSEEIRRIIAEIRKVCGSIDGRGCMAIEGEPDREMMEMLMEQVMDRLDQMPGQMAEDMSGMEAVETQMGDGRNWRRNLVEALIWQELLRRRMRRRRRGRNEGWRNRY